MKIAVIYLGSQILSISEKQEMEFISSESDIITGEESQVREMLDSLGISELTEEFDRQISERQIEMNVEISDEKIL